MFRKEALYKKFKEQGKSVFQQVRSQLLEQFLTLLKISEVSTYNVSYIQLYNYFDLLLTFHFSFFLLIFFNEGAYRYKVIIMILIFDPVQNVKGI